LNLHLSLTGWFYVKYKQKGRDLKPEGDWPLANDHATVLEGYGRLNDIMGVMTERFYLNETK
jgi:hypothetical protein